MDLFYDGSQDVPLRFRGGSGLEGTFDASGDPTFCESCNALIPASDMARGAATQVYGLALCETCRMKTRAEERIELYFCDRCHVSVPVYRVDTGEALGGDGRILCLGCRERETRKGVWPATAVTVALIGILAALLFWQWRVKPDGPAGRAVKSVGEVVGPGEALVARPYVSNVARGELSRRLDELAGVLNDLEARRDEAHKSLTQASGAIRRSRDEFSLRMDLLESETRSLSEEIARALDRSMPRR